MTIAALNRAPPKGDLTRERIKEAARDLFARYGFDRVTIRDIAKHSGQRNGGAVNYHFGSKEELIVEILNDVARERDQFQSEALDALEKSGKVVAVRDILRVLVSSSTRASSQQLRLFAMLHMQRRDLIHSEVPRRWDQGFRRGLDYLRALLPALPQELLTQRLYLMVHYIGTALATREGDDGQSAFWKSFWGHRSALESLLDTCEGMLVHAASADTLAALRQEQAAGEVPLIYP